MWPCEVGREGSVFIAAKDGKAPFTAFPGFRRQPFQGSTLNCTTISYVI
jgi:hypothetical protein